ncbi:hypothetical protein A5881_003054 [Enterococcus termitis]|nr:hypothetical protein A5881_002298 [Enterococcus termitis]
MIMKNMKGFTLIESLTVLFICTTFMLLPILAINKWKQVLDVEQFLSSFEKKLLFTQQMAIVNTSDTQIVFFEDSQQISFISSKRESVMGKESLQIPEDLHATGPSKIIFKRDSGNNGNLSKFSFLWTGKKKVIEFQFQMGSGRYVKKIQSL